MTATERWPYLREKMRGWQVLVALLIITVLDALLSDALSWYNLLPLDGEIASGLDPFAVLQPAVFAVTVLAWLLGKRQLQRRLALFYTSIVTLNLIVSIVGLVLTLTSRASDSGGAFLLADAAIVWASNILIFAIWYWLIDGGGAEKRETEAARADFVFPQQASALAGWENWRPGLLDYSFLAFTTSTAFSPTDTLVLSRRGKILMMMQATASLIILSMLAARAINIIV